MPDSTIPMTDLAPRMEPEGVALLQECLAGTKVYLEYGCGGSTLEAAKAGVGTVYSVDTNVGWVKEVRRLVNSRIRRGELIHCDFGELRQWGYPKTNEQFQRFHTYATSPWTVALANGDQPDLVLVDGRFRVASFLYSLARARLGTTILFDDYGSRPAYHVVEQFCKPVSLAGRMARFETCAVADPVELMVQFARYSVVPA